MLNEKIKNDLRNLAEIKKNKASVVDGVAEQVTRKEKATILVFTSSLRKRVAFALQLWALGGCKTEERPSILDDERVKNAADQWMLNKTDQKEVFDWAAFAQNYLPADFFTLLNLIPNGNNVADEVHELGELRGMQVIAMANTGETHRDYETVLTEAGNKARNAELAVQLQEIFGSTVIQVGFDSMAGSRRLFESGPDVSGVVHSQQVFGNQAETTVLYDNQVAEVIARSKPTEITVPGISNAQDAERIRLLREFVRGFGGSEEWTEILNICASAINVYEFVSNTPQLTEYYSLTISQWIGQITEELLDRIAVKLNAEAAGAQSFQWLIEALGLWEMFSDELFSDDALVFLEEQAKETIRRFRFLFTSSEVLGVSALPLLQAITQFEKETPVHA